MGNGRFFPYLLDLSEFNIVIRDAINRVSTKICIYSWVGNNCLRLNHIALMQGTVEDVDFEFDSVIRRERILHSELVIHRAANGFRFLRIAKAMKTGIESYRIVQHQRVVGASRHMRTQERCFHEHAIFRFQVINHHIIIMWVLEAERIQSVAIVEAEVAIAVGIRETDDALAAESTIGIEEITETRVCNLRLDWVFHLLLTASNCYSQQYEHYENRFLHHISFDAVKVRIFLL